MPFADRTEAGRRLGARLLHLRSEPVVVLGLPRGGVVVAFEVAKALDAPLDVIVVRKLGVPSQPELALGAIGEGGVQFVNRDLLGRLGVSDRELAEVSQREHRELVRRAERLRGDSLPVQIEGRTAVLVDDGVATGSSAQAAVEVARRRGASRVVLAVPVGAPDALAALALHCEVISLEAPRDLWAVGRWYRDFSQTSDKEVASLLARAARFGSTGEGSADRSDDPPPC